MTNGQGIIVCRYPDIHPIKDKKDWAFDIPLLSPGIVSFLADKEIIIAASIHHGNSGGPCADTEHRVIGIVSEMITPGDVDVHDEKNVTYKSMGYSTGYASVVPIAEFIDLAEKSKIKLGRPNKRQTKRG